MQITMSNFNTHVLYTAVHW